MRGASQNAVPACRLRASRMYGTLPWCGDQPRTIESVVRTILKRLEDLESAYQTQIAARDIYDARALLKERVDRMAARMRLGGDWLPVPHLTVEEVKQRVKAVFAMA